MRHGFLVLLSGPSGSGKGTVLRKLRRRHPEFIFPISLTTRSPRPHEKDGEVYRFVSEEEFEHAKKNGELLEWAVVHHDHSYGTLKKPILEALQQGRIVIREVDVQGVDSIRTLLSSDQVLTIFLTTPSWNDLKRRILKRAAMSDDELEHRRESYMREERIADTLYQYKVFSEEGKIDKMVFDIENIIDSESRKRL